MVHSQTDVETKEKKPAFYKVMFCVGLVYGALVGIALGAFLARNAFEFLDRVVQVLN